MSYAEAIQFLYGLQVFGAKLGLERMSQLAALAGNPEKKLRFIHVAGTNGKGSTCAMLDSVYRAAGLRVGLFTSPHLVSFRERIQVNRQLISQADVARLVAETRLLLKAFPADALPTMFEVVTLMSLNYFAEQRCDIVIWETGLGGRLDATNIITPLASVITNISYDHTQWLGDTLEKIAEEKAGIIKPGVPVVTAVEQPEGLSVIERVAREKNAPVTRVNTTSEVCHTALRGEHQQANAALARATVEVLLPIIPVSPEQFRDAITAVRWPGRLQLIEKAGRNYLLDCAHNLAGVKTLRDAIEREFPHKQWTFILGVLADKDWRAMCKMLAPLASQILLVPVGSERTALPEDLSAVCREANPQAAVTCYGSLPEALSQADQDEFVLVTGSLYLVGAALALLDPAFADASDERGLNEWRTN